MRKMHIIHLRVRRRWQSERAWRCWSIAGTVWSCFRLWIAWTIRPRGLEWKVYTKKGFHLNWTPEVGPKSGLWQEQLVMALPQNRYLRLSSSPRTALPGLPCSQLLLCDLVTPSSSKLWRGIVRLEKLPQLSYLGSLQCLLLPWSSLRGTCLLPLIFLLWNIKNKNESFSLPW